MRLTGNQLRQLRLLKNVKQETMAKWLGISQPAYSKLEKAELINCQRAEKLLHLLACTPAEFEALKKF